jgi:hypothetical protein
LGDYYTYYNPNEVIILTYDELLAAADNMSLVVKEKQLIGYDGRIKGNKIAIRKSIPTLKEKSCVLAEEIGHYLTTVGDILDLSKTENKKQEIRARAIAYDMQVGLMGIVDAFEAGCTSSFLISDYLGVTESFLAESIEYYRKKYGLCTSIDNYLIYFEPTLGVMRMM